MVRTAPHQSNYPPKSTEKNGTIPAPVEHYAFYLDYGNFIPNVLENLTGKWRLVYYNGKWYIQVQRRRSIPLFTTWVDESDILYEVPEVSVTYTCGT